MNPLPNVKKFIIERLKANAAILALVGTRVYDTLPPSKPANGESVVYPCIVVSFQGGTATDALSDEAIRIFELPVFLAKALTQSQDFGGAHEIANAIDEVLKNAHGTSSFGGRTVNIQGLRKQEWIEYQETEKDVRTNHVGATYRAFVSGLQ